MAGLNPIFDPLPGPIVRAVVVGYGFAGRAFHAYLIGLAAPEMVLHGIVARDAAVQARIAGEHPDCRVYASVEDALADPDVDLLVLATPSHTHAALAVAALDAGKHVVTDKVMCLNLAECDQMLDAAARNRRLLTVFQNRRWDGDFLTVRSLMARGADSEIGTVRWVEMAWQGMGAWGGWRGKAESGGGRFFDLGAHLIDQLLVLFPQAIETVYCRQHHDYPESDIDSEAVVLVTFAGGATGICDLSGMTAISKPRFLLHGDRATFAKYGLDPQEKAMIAGNIDAATEDPENYATVKGSPSLDYRLPTFPGRWRTFYENLTSSLLRGTQPAVKMSEMRRVMAVIDAAQTSARTGEVVHLSG